MKRKAKYTEQEFRDAVSQVYSIAKLLEKLGLCAEGGNYKIAKKNIEQWDVDISHFSGQAWRKGSDKPVDKAIPLQEILAGLHPHYQSHKLRLRLLKDGIFQHICSCCGNTHWNDDLIPLELDHIDGNNKNHKQENLRLLCPNCHSQTDNFRGKNKKKQ